MNVYVLWSDYYDYCNVWNKMLGVYQNEDDAITEQIRLEALVSKDDDQQSYSIEEVTLK